VLVIKAGAPALMTSKANRKSLIFQGSTRSRHQKQCEKYAFLMGFFALFFFEIPVFLGFTENLLVSTESQPLSL
jgi:hypothetical protein